MDTVIRLEQVRKSYGRRLALDGLDLAVERGRVMGLLGLNGSGKTTTMRLVAGLLRADAGRLEVLGSDPWTFTPTRRKRIGYLSERDFPFPEFSLEHALSFVASLHGGLDETYVRALADVLRVPGEQRYYALSRGQQRKFQLVVTLAPKPELVLLDDPAQGLDVGVRREFVQGILPLLAEGRTTVVLSSHILTDVERFADSVAIVRRGKVVLHSDLDDLKESARELVVARGAETELGRPLRRSVHGDEVRVTVLDASPARVETLRRSGALRDARALSLEELFLAVVEDETAEVAR